MTTQTLRFTIEADGVVERARELVIAKAYGEAIKLLTDCFVGMDTDTAIAILKGEKTLTGNDADKPIQLVDETAEAKAAYEAELAGVFAGVVRLGPTRHFRPYAVVTNFGPNDIRDIRTIPTGRDADKLGSIRASHYMLDPRKDIAVILDVPYTPANPNGNDRTASNVLFQRVAAPPFWMSHSTILVTDTAKFQAAFDEALAAGINVAYTGHRQVYGDGPYEPLDTALDRKLRRRHARNMPKRNLLREAEDSVTDGLADMGMALGMKPADAVSFAKGLRGPGWGLDDEEEEDEGGLENVPTPEPGDPTKCEYGWIVPDGRFFPCEYFGHRVKAEIILAKVFGLTPDNPEAEVEKQGWVKIGRSAIAVTNPKKYQAPGDEYLVFSRKRPTRKQKETFADWAMAHGVPIDRIDSWIPMTDAPDDENL